MSNFIICFWKFILHHHPTTPKIHDISNEIFFTQDYIFGDIFKSHILSYAFDNSLDIITKQLQKSKISAIRYFLAHSHMFKDILECRILSLSCFRQLFIHYHATTPKSLYDPRLDIWRLTKWHQRKLSKELQTLWSFSKRKYTLHQNMMKIKI